MSSRKPVGLSILMHRQPSLDHNLPFVRSPLGSPMVLSGSPPSPPPFLSSSESASSIESFTSEASVEAPAAPWAAGGEQWKQRGQQLVLNSAWQTQAVDDGEAKETPPMTPACTTCAFDFGLQGGALGLGVGLGVGGGGFMRRELLRRNSAISATSSVEDDNDEDDQNSWTEEEKVLLQQTFDSYLESAATTEAPIPKFGPPPPNLTHIVAKAVVAQPAPKPIRSPTRSRTSPVASSPSSLGPEAAERPKWRHGMRSTRAQIVSLVKERQTVDAGLEATPRPDDATPRACPSSVPLARANSMDFLPVSLPGGRVGAAARLGARLQEGTEAEATGLTLRRPMFAAMARTNSLSSIAGSPSQPARPSQAKATNEAGPKPVSGPSAAAAAAFSAFHLAPHPGSSSMARSGSDCGPSVDRLDRLPALAGSHSSPEVPQWSFPSGAGPSNSARRAHAFDASAKQPAGAGRGLDAAFSTPPSGHKRTTSGSARKRLATGTGLGAPVAVDARGGSPTPPAPSGGMQCKMLFPDLVVTEHGDGTGGEDEDEAPTRSMKSLSLHPTVEGDGKVEAPGGYFGAWA